MPRCPTSGPPAHIVFRSGGYGAWRGPPAGPLRSETGFPILPDSPVSASSSLPAIASGPLQPPDRLPGTCSSRWPRKAAPRAAAGPRAGRSRHAGGSRPCRRPLHNPLSPQGQASIRVRAAIPAFERIPVPWRILPPALPRRLYHTAGKPAGAGLRTPCCTKRPLARSAIVSIVWRSRGPYTAHNTTRAFRPGSHGSRKQ
jgi:hypothetical protein